MFSYNCHISGSDAILQEKYFLFQATHSYRDVKFFLEPGKKIFFIFSLRLCEKLTKPIELIQKKSCH